MLRSLFLYLSGAHWAKSLIMRVGLARRTAHRFVAGDTLAEGLAVSRQMNARGIDVSLDHLGESVTDEAGAAQATAAYLELLDAIQGSGRQISVSVKLTQLGLDVSEDLCVNNLRRILQRAKEQATQVTIDMESSDYTEQTLKVYRMLRHDYEFENVGIVIQAYLYRSEADMQALAEEGAHVRLCKGAYKEPSDRAFPDKADVDANYIHLFELFLNPAACTRGAYLCFATHDEKMINAAKRFIKGHSIPFQNFEFQMLYGIRSKLQQQLHDDGYPMRVYVPYGTEWYPYLMRRLAERPANVWFFASNFFRR